MVDPGHVSLQDVVDLRWRDETLSVKEIHDKITRVLYMLDRNSEVSVQLAETTAKNVVERCRLEGSSVWIWARKRKFIVRAGRTPGTLQWLAEFVHVGHEIVRVLDSQQPSKCRQFQYVTGGPSRRSKEHVKQMVMNWAVTLEVHPICLGIALESTGSVFTPEGFKIKCTQKRNMITRVETHWVIQPGREPIPQNIVDLKVINGKDIEAIVVTEHRNLHTDLPGFITSNKNVIVVMTGGFSCLATREFLRLLSDSRALKNTPFLWISDHDPHAFQVYTSLKYGSKAMAWLSPSTCVNKLEFFGPTESHFDQLVDQEIAARKLEIKARQPRLTDTEVDRRATEQMKGIRDRFFTICRQKLNKNDLTILKNVKKSSHQDHWLNMEVNSMFQTQRGKFGMHEIDSIAKGNSLAFVLQAAKSFTPAPAPPTGRGQVSRPLRLRTAQLANRIEMSGGLNLSGTG